MELDVPERSGCGGQIDLELIEKYYLHDSRYIGGMHMPPAMCCYTHISQDTAQHHYRKKEVKK
jgi:hypothetical protein